jgi:hypothetical protein
LISSRPTRIDKKGSSCSWNPAGRAKRNSDTRRFDPAKDNVLVEEIQRIRPGSLSEDRTPPDDKSGLAG